MNFAKLKAFKTKLIRHLKSTTVVYGALKSEKSAIFGNHTDWLKGYLASTVFEIISNSLS